MSTVSYVKAIILVMAVITVIGCKAKQDKAESNSSAAPQNAGQIKSMSGQNTTGALVASPQDQADARSAAAHVLAQLEAGDFPAIYKESAAGFKQIGSETAFVAKFNQTRQKVGVLKNPHEISFASHPDKGHVLVYRLENQNFKTDMRLTFARSKSGKMELSGLNQHDELKK